MGDLNAKIGSDNRGYEEIMGQQGLGEMNDNLVMEGVSSNTKESTRPLGYHRTCRRKTKSTTCVSGRSSDDHFRMSA
ncbi:hypothetical protein V1264_001528 [Littorina saxatilis]|uniref:Uncharacterized protein n=1 Tax=Littorina saxatilis TaxID=31220 RepID=A0AAN9C1Q7_9CAEN